MELNRPRGSCTTRPPIMVAARTRSLSNTTMSASAPGDRRPLRCSPSTLAGCSERGPESDQERDPRHLHGQRERPVHSEDATGHGFLVAHQDGPPVRHLYL